MATRTVRWFPTLLVVAVSVAGCDALFGGDPKSTCIDNRILPVGQTFFEDIGDTDCEADGRPRDQYNLTLASPQVLRISVLNEVPMANSITVASEASGSEVAVAQEEGTTDRFLYVALGVGNHRVYYGAAGDDRGAYMITTESFVAPSPTGCVTSTSRFFYVGRGSRVDGGLGGTDCNATGGTRDLFTLLAKAGQSYTIKLTPTVAAAIEVLDGIDVETSANAPAGQMTTLTFTAAAARTLRISISSATTGTYSFSLD